MRIDHMTQSAAVSLVVEVTPTSSTVNVASSFDKPVASWTALHCTALSLSLSLN